MSSYLQTPQTSNDTSVYYTIKVFSEIYFLELRDTDDQDLFVKSE